MFDLIRLETVSVISLPVEVHSAAKHRYLFVVFVKRLYVQYLSVPRLCVARMLLQLLLLFLLPPHPLDLFNVEKCNRSSLFDA